MITPKYYWAVFVYKCFDNSPKILLFEQNNNNKFTPVVLENIKPREFEKAKGLFTKVTGIKKGNCFPSRFFENSRSFSFQKGEKKLIVSTTSVRLLNEIDLENFVFLKKGEWILKEEAFGKLKYDKLYFRALKDEFGEDLFWECLDTVSRNFN